MKIMVITPYYPPNYTAGSTRIYEMVKRLAQKPEVDNIEVVLWNPNYDYDINRIPALQKVTVHYSNLGKNLPNLLFKYQDPNPFHAFCWFLLTAHCSRKFNPDLVIFTTPPGTVLTGALWSKFIKNRYIIDYRDSWQERNRQAISNRLGIASLIAKGFQTVLEMIECSVNNYAELILKVHESIVHNANLEKGPNVIIVPNGINPEEVENLGDGDISREIANQIINKNMIVYVGYLGLDYYEPEIIFPSVHEIIQTGENLHLLLFSARKDPAIAEKARSLGISDNVKVIEMDHRQMLAIAKKAKFGYIPLKAEDPQSGYVIPVKLYDYISIGLPVLVIADEGSQVYRIIQEHGNGIAISWREIDDRLLPSVKTLLKDGTYREKAEVLVPDFLRLYDRRKYFDKLMDNIRQ